MAVLRRMPAHAHDLPRIFDALVVPRFVFTGALVVFPMRYRRFIRRAGRLDALQRVAFRSGQFFPGILKLPVKIALAARRQHVFLAVAVRCPLSDAPRSQLIARVRVQRRGGFLHQTADNARRLVRGQPLGQIELIRPLGIGAHPTLRHSRRLGRFRLQLPHRGQVRHRIHRLAGHVPRFRQPPINHRPRRVRRLIQRLLGVMREPGQLADLGTRVELLPRLGKVSLAQLRFHHLVEILRPRRFLFVAG